MESNGRLARAARGHSVALKMVVIGILILVLLVPLLILQSVVREREQRRSEAEAEIMKSWGGAQTIGGPILTVPYVARGLNENGKRVETVELAYFLPDTLSVEGTLLPETRARGMYEVTVYGARLAFSGTFHAPDFSGWRVSPRDIMWDQATLSVELPDMRAIQERAPLVWGTTRSEFRPGKGDLGMFAGEIRAPLTGIGPERAPSARDIPFSFNLALRGGDSLTLLPLADEMTVHIQSPWKSPNFHGAFLPSQRAVAATGFDASWRIISMARAYPQRWKAREIEPSTVRESGFGVSLMTPVDTYLKVTRALKYGILFLVLPFCTLFLFEVFSGRRIHPFQFLLVGLADCIFYLLLLSLSEHMGFGFAYAVAAIACAGLVTLYSVAALKSRAGWTMLPVLGAGYAFLAVVLSSEDYALLIGACGLFILLATVMFLTRRVDWFQAGHEKTLDAGSELPLS
jgi:inner membrane protein